MKLSFCLTNYNRCDLLLKSFAQIIDDDRISEVVIVDDASNQNIFDDVFEAVGGMPKVKLFRNTQNIGMAANKARSVELAENEWCIVADSDNVFTPEYLNAFCAYKGAYKFPDGCMAEPIENVIYCPDFAMPTFDYTQFSAQIFNKENAKRFIGIGTFGACLNTSNFIVHRQTYLDTFTPDDKIKGTDTIWHLYNHFKRGGCIYIVPGMRYFHLTGHVSEFTKDMGYNMHMAGKIEKMIAEL